MELSGSVCNQRKFGRVVGNGNGWTEQHQCLGENNLILFLIMNHDISGSFHIANSWMKLKTKKQECFINNNLSSQA